MSCGTSRHCADHGWCHRCEPSFASLMAEINAILQSKKTSGEAYAEIGRLLRDPAEEATQAQPSEGSPLSPFSGDNAVCSKCSYVGAGTRHRAHGEAPDREEGTQSLGDTWPERLERECGRCCYRWDEALNPPT